MVNTLLMWVGGVRESLAAPGAGPAEDRLPPTVIVRPGRPNAATTSCFSGIVREPLAGVDVGRGPAICCLTTTKQMSQLCSNTNEKHGRGDIFKLNSKAS